ncbi:hypothetical protein J7K05_02365 [bacterium]|nr:hypothetical protein [bacterium]
MVSIWSSALQEAYQEVFVRLGDFVPRLFGAVVVFAVGWLVAWLLQRLVDPVLRGVLDPVWEVTKLEDLRKKSKIQLDLTALAARLVFWVVLAVVFLATFEVLGLSSVADLFNQVLAYVPNVVGTLVILMIGLVLANFLRGTVRAAMNASELPHAQLLSSITYWAVVVFVVVAGLIQLGIAQELLLILFQGLVAALAIAVGLSFGFGGQDYAKRVLGVFQKEMTEEEREEEEDEEI